MLKLGASFKRYLVMVICSMAWVSNSWAAAPECQVSLQTLKDLRSLQEHQVKLADWAQDLFSHRKASKSFTEASNSGYIFSEVSAKFDRPFALMQSPDLQSTKIMEELFSRMTFTPCAHGACRVSQEIGGFIKRLDYTLDYRFVTINSLDEATQMNIPSEAFKNDHFPKYVMVQLGTEWSKLFNQTEVITIFEGSPENSNVIYANALQFLNLTMIGSMGRGKIAEILKGELQYFISVFEKWAQEEASALNK